MSEKKESLIIIISAPSGSGKTTLVNHLLECMPEVRRSVSYTTRPPREGEKDKEDYVFISEKDFRGKIEKDEFLEWEENFGNYYGTSRVQLQEAIEDGADIILSIDIKGARTVKTQYPESITIFIMPPSEEELAARLKKRNTDREKQVAIRLEQAQREIAAADEYDYLLVNEDLEKAVEELKIIINTEKANRAQITQKRMRNNGRDIKG